MTLTDEQNAAIEFAKTDESVVIQARAGCAKTTMCKEIAKSRPRRKHVLVVFNKKNATDLDEDASRPRNLSGATFHSMCMTELRSHDRKIKVDADKMRKMVVENDDFNSFERKISNEVKTQRRENYAAMMQLLGLAKNWKLEMTLNDMLSIIIKYNICPMMPHADFAYLALDFLAKSDKDSGTIDFDDMIRFYAMRDLGKDFMGDVFMNDESQDNTPMRTIILGQIKEVAQVIAVGDDRQAIYAFAGADSDSINNIISTLNCDVLPLSTNFRCDKAIIRHAQRLVPDIQFHPDKPEGIVRTVNSDNFLQLFKPGDVAIARSNRVIISKCFRFIRDGKAATIQGKDFGNMLKSMVKGFQAHDIKDFYEKLQTWYDRSVDMAVQNGTDVSDAVEDRYQCLKFLADSCRTVAEIDNRIDAIFSDVKDDRVFKFSTAHKSKGLEWDNVFILENDKFKSTNPKMPHHQLIQEDNLLYIAGTRAKHELSLVEDIPGEEAAKLVAVSMPGHGDKNTDFTEGDSTWDEQKQDRYDFSSMFED